MAETTKVKPTLKWKGEVTFEGTIEQFYAFKTAIENHPISITVPEYDNKRFQIVHGSGYISPAALAGLKQAQLEKLTAGEPRVQFARIKNIAGGIRTPHLHLADEVVLVDKERFKTFLGEIARSTLDNRVDTEEDYYDMIKPIAEG
jgi:hypothetical protein